MTETTISARATTAGEDRTGISSKKSGVGLADDRPIVHVLNMARWAPSGDNTQPWRFEIVDDHHVVVHGFDTRDHSVYDVNGRPSQLSLGALLQTIEIAATVHGWATHIRRRVDLPETTPTFDVRFSADAALRPDPLAAAIESRSVQRRAMSRRTITSLEKAALEQAVGLDYSVRWIEGFQGRLSAALLMFRNARIRLTMPEAYDVHRSVIAWKARFSETRIPAEALGANPMTLRLMQYVMHSWERVRFFNTFLAGTWAPRIEMDLLPSLACGAHVLIFAKRQPQGIDDWLQAGRAVQRMWLTATNLRLHHQPEMTPLIFSAYVREGKAFSRVPGLASDAARVAGEFSRIAGPEANRAVWMGRIGAGNQPASRSLRMPLADLMRSPGQRSGS